MSITHKSSGARCRTIHRPGIHPTSPLPLLLHPGRWATQQLGGRQLVPVLRLCPYLRLTFAPGPAKSLRNTCPSFITNFTRSSSVTSFAGLPEKDSESDQKGERVRFIQMAREDRDASGENPPNRAVAICSGIATATSVKPATRSRERSAIRSERAEHRPMMICVYKT